MHRRHCLLCMINHLAADGKTLRGTLDHAKEAMPSVHILYLYDCSTGITIQHYVYKNDESEISAAKEVLKNGLIKGSVVTTDALYTFKQWCAWMHARGAYYLVVVKKNTPVLYQNLEDFFGDPDILKYECDYFKKVQKGHGRLETREIWTSTQLSIFLEKEWGGVAQVYMIRKTVIEKGEKTITFRYGITNLPKDMANAERVLELRQNHWRIGATRFRLNALEKRGDGEQGKTLTTDHTMVGAIPIPPGEGGKAAASLQRLVLNVMKQGEMRKSFDLDKVISATQVPMASASETSLNRRYSERAYPR